MNKLNKVKKKGRCECKKEKIKGEGNKRVKKHACVENYGILTVPKYS
jgi:hypothetical protein